MITKTLKYRGNSRRSTDRPFKIDGFRVCVPVGVVEVRRKSLIEGEEK